MKIITTELPGRENYFSLSQPSRLLHLRSRVEQLLTWLGGIDTHKFNVAEKLVSRSLPQGITIPQASADQLGRATKRAMESDPSQVEQIVRFVFSSLKAHEGEKVEAVISYMVLVVNRADISKLVQIAVRARPSLAPTIANTAAMLVPEEADHISSAVASVVVTFS